ncbi:MAG: FtsQ-type POTRA domain-containing protein [Alphaproteobacteria bacterium]|uniref:FtsQ-type POTRA domain-containing protein n=1 Tax=Candidatus Nitrobium versatile TaxID=2884831 RepID=A0A953M314_9BACT|nr:FtsQ-type POTRA domain-containing protein [Candidatus Nitrobium versatile]
MDRRNLRTLRRRRERGQYRLVAAAVLLSLSVCLGIFYSLKYLVRVKEIVFLGNSHLRNEELRSLVKLKQDEEMFRFSGRQIYHNLKRSPWIKEAIIRRELSGRVLVRVMEGVPLAVVSLADRPYLVDREGVILEPIKEGTALFLPVIKEIDPGTNKSTYGEAVRLIEMLRGRKSVLYDGNVVITGNRPEDLTMNVGGIAIRVGTGDFEKKLERLAFVREEVQKRNMTVEYIDLRFSNKIIVKPVVQETPEPQEEIEKAGKGSGKKAAKKETAREGKRKTGQKNGTKEKR